MWCCLLLCVESLSWARSLFLHIPLFKICFWLYYHEQKRICTWNFLQKQQTLAVLAEELVDDVWRNSKWDALSGEVSITRITQGDIELPLPPNSLDSHQTWKPKSWTLGLTPRPHFIWRYTNADLKICLKSLSLYRNNLLKIS